MPNNHADTSPAKDFESAMARLEEITTRLEAGQVPLAEALAAFEEGMRLADYCARELEQAEQKVAILREKEGKAELAPFTVDDDNATP